MICSNSFLYYDDDQKHVWKSFHRLHEAVDENKEDGLVDVGGDAGGGGDRLQELEAEGEDGGEEERRDEDLNRKYNLVKNRMRGSYSGYVWS